MKVTYWKKKGEKICMVCGVLVIHCACWDILTFSGGVGGVSVCSQQLQVCLLTQYRTRSHQSKKFSSLFFFFLFSSRREEEKMFLKRKKIPILIKTLALNWYSENNFGLTVVERRFPFPLLTDRGTDNVQWCPPLCVWEFRECVWCEFVWWNLHSKQTTASWNIWGKKHKT